MVKHQVYWKKSLGKMLLVTGGIALLLALGLFWMVCHAPNGVERVLWGIPMIGSVYYGVRLLWAGGHLYNRRWSLLSFESGQLVYYPQLLSRKKHQIIPYPAISNLFDRHSMVNPKLEVQKLFGGDRANGWQRLIKWWLSPSRYALGRSVPQHNLIIRLHEPMLLKAVTAVKQEELTINLQWVEPTDWASLESLWRYNSDRDLHFK